MSQSVLNLISGDSISEEKNFLIFLKLFLEGIFGKTMRHLIILFFCILYEHRIEVPGSNVIKIPLCNFGSCRLKWKGTIS